MAATASRGVFRAGKVLSPDSKWTGEEPDWHGWESWTTEKFYAEKMRMLRFYGYYLGQADMKPAVLAYMKNHKYSKSDIALISAANPNILPATVGKLVRAMDRGMPSIHPDAAEHFESLPFQDPDKPAYVPKDDNDTVLSEINSVLQFLRASAEPTVKAGEPTPAKPAHLSMSPIQKLAVKVDREVITHLDEMLDRWIVNSSVTKVDGLAMTSFIRDGNIPAAGCKHITDWLNKQLAEYQGAYDKTDPDLVEGYSHMSKPALKNRITVLEGMIADVVKHSNVSKALRKPRAKKIKDAGKQVARLKFQQSSKDFDLESINPTRVPSAQRLYTFNTKYRQLGVYIASGNVGFEVKGTSLKNFDVATSYITTLRKPKEVLNAIISSTPKQVDKYLESMKCKKRKGNGRINPQTILVRAVDVRV
jgi:hypothetical protein